MAAQVTESSAFGHTALVYGSEDEYLAGALPFLREGIDGGEGCLALTTPSAEAALRAHLPQSGRAVQFEDPTGWYTTSPGAMVARLDRCFSDFENEGRRVRILGGVRWDGLTQLARRSWQRYEAALNPAFAGRGAALLCAYDTRTLDDDIVDTARRTHPALGDGSQPNGDYVEPATFCAEWDLESLSDPTPPVTELVFDATTLAAARTVAADEARSGGLSEDRTDDLVLAVGEVTANAVRHARGSGRLRAWREDRHLVFEVADEGMIPPNPLVGWLPPTSESTGQFGLWMARQLVDHVETRYDAGLRVRLYTEIR